MTIPTANPVPSNSPQDLLFNAEKLDEVVNAAAPTYVDRFGKVRLTAQGATDTIKSVNSRGAWAAATPYLIKDLVQVSGTWYIAVAPHLSGATFLGDAVNWRVYQGVLLSDLEASSGSTLIGHIQAWVGAVMRTIQSWIRERPPSPRDFGGIGDGSADDTDALQKWLNFCYTNGHREAWLPVGYWAVRESSAGSGYALLNKGVSIVGEGSFYSQIVPMPSMPNTADFIRVTPDDGAYIDFLEFGRFSIDPGYGGTKRGRHGIFMNFMQATNLSRLHAHDLYILPGNDYSFKVENNNVINAQGVPANSVIERNAFWEGMYLNKIGDSNSIRNNVLRSSGGGRPGVHLYMSDTSGVASHTMIVENNIDCVGGAVYVLRARNVKVLFNNIELSAGTGTPNGSIVDIDGSSGVIPFAEVTGNHIGVFGTATPSSAIRINGSLGATVDKNTILSGVTVAAAIFLTSSASDTDIGFNEIQSTYTLAVSNGGVRTMGVLVALGMLNGFTNAGGGYQALSATKNRNGGVSLNGSVNCPASPSGIIIATLPLGFRPFTIQRGPVTTTTSGLIVGYAMEIDVSGNVVCYCSVTPGATTRIDVNLAFHTLPYLSGSL